MQDQHDQSLSQWWAKWFEKDFTWNGLEAYPLKDISIPSLLERANKSEPSEKRSLTLKDYWRFISSKVAHENNSLLSDEDLEDAGVLIRDGEGGLWHRAHLPLRYKKGNDTNKLYWNEVEKSRLDAEVAFALRYSRSTRWDLESGDAVYTDGRARLDGTVILQFPPDIDFPISVKMNFAYIDAPFILTDKIIGSGSNFDDTWLLSADFSRSHFGEASQHGYISFDRARFSGPSSFNQCIFNTNVQFMHAVFRGYASLEEVNFKQECRFTGASFGDFCEFDRSIFEKEVWFTNTNWTNGFGNSFTRVIFRGLPGFYGAQFHKNTSFWGAKFEVVSYYINKSRRFSKRLSGPLGMSLFTFWVSFVLLVSFPYRPLLTPLAVTLYAGLTSSIFFLQVFGVAAYLGLRYVNEWEVETLTRAFAVLAQLCDDVKSKNDSVMFRSLQNKLLRLVKGNSIGEILVSRPVEIFVSYIYDVCSGYGTSLIRPPLSLLFVLVGCATIYSSVEEGGYKISGLASARAHPSFDSVATSYDMSGAMNYSLSRVLPLGEWHEDSDYKGCTFSKKLFLEKSSTNSGICVPDDVYIDQKIDRPRRILTANIVGIVESIITTLLIFLFALALRRRFQLD